MSSPSNCTVLLLTLLTCWAFSCEQPPAPADNHLVRIRGKVFKSDGSPAVNMAVEYIILNYEHSNYLAYTKTNADGTFEMLTPVSYGCSYLNINHYSDQWESVFRFQDNAPLPIDSAAAGQFVKVDIDVEDTEVDLRDLPIHLKESAILNISFAEPNSSNRIFLNLESSSSSAPRREGCFAASKLIQAMSTTILAAGDTINIMGRFATESGSKDSTLAVVTLEAGINDILL